jgi:hypothetical protein
MNTHTCQSAIACLELESVAAGTSCLAARGTGATRFSDIHNRYHQFLPTSQLEIWGLGMRVVILKTRWRSSKTVHWSQAPVSLLFVLNGALLTWSVASQVSTQELEVSMRVTHTLLDFCSFSKRVCVSSNARRRSAFSFSRSRACFSLSSKASRS